MAEIPAAEAASRRPGRMSERLRRMTRPTIRLRLTVLYGLLFLITGAVLLTIGYLLVRHNLSARPDFRRELRRLGIAVPSQPPFFQHRLGFGPGSPESRVANAVRNQLSSQALHRLVLEYAAALGVMSVVSAVAGWLMAGRALRPLRRITATARGVSGENLRERIALAGPEDELKELADTFDGMLARLDQAFASQRHFVANASHELRTPLAIMRAEVDVALADPDASLDELRQMGAAIRESLDRCERLLESLLMLARSEAPAGHAEPVDLSALAGDCLTDLRARAEEAGVALRDDLEPARVAGEPALLERMIANLLENAIRYNEPGGFVQVSTHRSDGNVSLSVVNTGRRIEPQKAAALVEPFRRLDREGGGFGLGLSIVRTVAEAHGGQVTIQARPAGGLAVAVWLPAERAGASHSTDKGRPALSRG
jgi:signal transduction histidine kinase